MKRLLALLLVVPLATSEGQQSNRFQASPLEDSIASIQSSGARAVALRSAAQTSDRDTLLMVMRVARNVPSSTDKSRLLTTLAPRYLGTGDRVLTAAFFRVARSVPSSEELRDLLVATVPYAAKSEDVASAIIEVARLMPSSPDRSEVLTTLVESGALKSEDVRTAFVEATMEIPGVSDRQRAIRAASRQ
jgi:hypothetical protein